MDSIMDSQNLMEKTRLGDEVAVADAIGSAGRIIDDHEEEEEEPRCLDSETQFEEGDTDNHSQDNRGQESDESQQTLQLQSAAALVASIQIPHLQISSNKDSSNVIGCNGSDNQLRFHSVEEDNQDTASVFNNNPSLENVQFVNLNNSTAAATQGDESIIINERMELSSQDSQKANCGSYHHTDEFGLDEEMNPSVNNCSNCKTLLGSKDESQQGMESKNFHELLPHQYYNPFTGGHTDVQIVDALSEIFKIQWTCQNYAEIYKRDDLALCIECASILTQLYKLYNEFSSLTIKSNAFLKTVINFQKDLVDEMSLEFNNKNGRNSSPLGVFYNGNGGEISSDSEESSSDSSVETKNAAAATAAASTPSSKSRRRSNRNRKKAIKYGENSDFDEELEFGFKAALEEERSEGDNNDANRSVMNQQVNIKRERIVSEEEDADSSFEFMVGLNNGESEGDQDSNLVYGGKTHNNYDENEPLQNVIQRISGYPLLPGGDGISKEPLECKDCNKVFLFPVQLRIHINSQSHKDKLKRSKQSKSQSRTNKGSKKGKGAQPPKICRCGKHFPTTKQLNRHKKSCINFDEGGGHCDRCGKKFKTQGGLRIHYAAHKRDDSKYSCKECGKKFRKMEALELHEKTDHGGFKPHACPQCDKCFRLKDKLKLHIMVIHEKRKPFPCSKCEKSFRTKYHLKIHDVSQHIQGGDNSIGCSQCKRKFPDRDALEKHLVVHQQDKPYICSVCSKGFQTTARLKLHEKSHQEVPSCLCPICGRAYKHIRDLKLHEVVHQDESTYRFGCGDCPRRFYRIDLLRVHQSNEKHFSPETIGPTVTKSSQVNGIGSDGDQFEFRSGIIVKGSNNHHHHTSSLIEDDEDDENETDSESTTNNQHVTVISHQQTRKTRQVSSNRKSAVKRGHQASSNKNQTSSAAARERDMTVMHPQATVIYHNPTATAMVQLQLDQSTVIQQSSSGQIGAAAGGTVGNISNASLHISQQQQQTRYAHEIQSTGATATAYTIVNQRDARQTLHQAATSLMQGIQIQPVSSSTGHHHHPHIQFSNNTIYTTMRDAAGNPTINISNVGNPADPMQYDNIISFINNLG